MTRTIAVSGGFDPLHVGHISLFEAAAQKATHLAVLVESDEWVARKHPPTLPQADRVKLLRAIRTVDYVVPLPPSGEWPAAEEFEIDLYGVGPDHADLDFPEREECEDRGIPIVVLEHGRAEVHSRDLLARAAKPRWVNPPVTVDGLITRYGKLLVTRRGPGCDAGVGMLDLPGGFLEEGESLEGCLMRECAEEVGREVYFLEYERSSHGILPDGRSFLNVILRGVMHDDPIPTAEVSEILWCDRMPNGAWFSECCRKAAWGWFARRGG